MEIFDQVEQAIQPSVQAGITTNIGGQVADLGNLPPPGLSAYSEPLGIIVAVVILLLALGSFTSMAVPIGVALVSVFAFSHPIVDILSADFTIGTIAPILGSMIGIGVGIDYSLFIVSRYRQNMAAGSGVEEAVGTAIATSGSAVLFAGLTVCLALCGLILVGIPYVTNLGLIAALFVLVTVSAALTLVPAILGAVGRKINAGRIHHRDETGDVHSTLSARWAGETSKHPVIFALASFVVLVLLALPVRSMELGFSNDASLPSSLTQQQAYVALAKNFGPGANGPLVVAIDLPAATQQNALGLLDAISNLTNALRSTDGVADVSMPMPNRMPSSADPSAIPTAVIVEVTPAADPMSEQTNELVKELRSDVIPQALRGSAIPPSQVYVGGQTALLIDLTDAIQAKLPAFIGGVIAGAFLLLMMVFRSLFVPAKAAVMNLLSIGGAYGIIVAVFQWGWGKELLGLETTVPIVAFVPVMMFAVLFGLSMDYEVFLLHGSRRSTSARERAARAWSMG
jgi:RND superfamily putative drug exporter